MHGDNATKMQGVTGDERQSTEGNAQIFVYFFYDFSDIVDAEIA